MIPSGCRVHLPVTSPTASAFPKSSPWVGFPESPRNGDAARKLDQYAVRKVDHLRGGSFYALLI